jgi:hypothetical protein
MTRLCGNAEWFMHGVHVLKADRTPEAMADAFSAVLNGSVDLNAMGPRLAAVIRRDFELGTVLPRIEAALREASTTGREGAGPPDEAYRLALLGERLSRVIVQDWWRRSA